VDWYGNARPIFLRGRVLALMGYEIVEGAMEGGRIRERRRVSFAPRVPPAAVGGEWTFTETIGGRIEPYFCSSRGTMRLDQQGTAVAMTYRQTGECTIEGVTRSSEGTGEGRGTVRANELSLEVNACRYLGTVRSAGRIEGSIQCRVTVAGRETTVHGRWQASRRSGE
jgi:hypothetical protein